MTSSQHAPHIMGHTRATMNITQCVANLEKRRLIFKCIQSSDYWLKLANMKLESLVIAGQLYSGEYVLEPCTHRPSHHGSWFYSKLKFYLIVKLKLATKVKS